MQNAKNFSGSLIGQRIRPTEAFKEIATQRYGDIDELVVNGEWNLPYHRPISFRNAKGQFLGMAEDFELLN